MGSMASTQGQITYLCAELSRHMASPVTMPSAMALPSPRGEVLLLLLLLFSPPEFGLALGFVDANRLWQRLWPKDLENVY